MFDTGRRFKVVFAGLQNVRRFKDVPNLGLAHFGQPLCVGPLEPKAAIRLIREPIETLGYTFQDEAAVLRILSYTNYHPGLIQLFCQELLKRLHHLPLSDRLPYVIEKEDVEAVYRTHTVRERIRERFEWTLALDPRHRYEAIAWSLIVDQMATRDGYSRPYSPSEILRLVSGWWPAGFKNVESEDLRSFLEEMVDLGVLVRTSEGLYRLRSPNLVSLMGTEDDIETRLLELSDKELPTTHDTHNHYTLLEKSTQSFSPLTQAQESSLGNQKVGVILLFASQALGLESIPAAVQHLAQPPYLPDSFQGEYFELPPEGFSAESYLLFLEKFWQQHAHTERLFILQRLGNLPMSDLRGQVEAAIDFCTKRQSSKRWLRLTLLFDPQMAWYWFSLPASLRENLENRSEACIVPHRISLEGVRQRLWQLDKMATPEICSRVLDVTGGWPLLFARLLERCRQDDDPRSCAMDFEKNLNSFDSPLNREFLQALGFKYSEAATIVLGFITKEGRVPLDMVAPEWMKGNPPLNPEDCWAAVEFLHRLGCLEIDGDSVAINHTVRKAWLQA